MFWGIVLFITFSEIFNSYSIYAVFIFAFIVSGCFAYFTSILRHYQITKPKIAFSGTEIIIILTVLLFFVVIYSRQTTLDTINHFFFAEQIRQDKIPPSIHGFPQIPIKYHYGWDLILGLVKRHSELNYAVLSSLLTLLLIFSNISIVAAYLKSRKFNNLLFTSSLILLFMGGGFFSLLRLILFNEDVNGLSLPALFGQSSWLFGIGVFFVLLDFFNDFELINKKQLLLKSIYILPVLISIGLLSASGYVLILGGFIILMIYLFINLKLKAYNKLIIYAAAYFLFFYFISQKIGGMLIRGEYFDDPVFVIAPLKLDFKVYSVRIAAYLFALAPIGLYLIFHLLKKYYKDPISYFKVSLHDFFLNTSGLVLFLFPLFIWVENAAYWDNFCKFNYYAIIAAWLIFADSFLRNLLENKSITIGLIVISILLLSINESFLSVYNSFRRPNQLKRYSQVIKKNENLIKAVKVNIPLDQRIYLLNRRLDGMYEINRKTNKSKVNLYQYIFQNFDDFTSIAMEAGRSVANFYDYNMFIDRSLEYDLWSDLDMLYKGNNEVLSKLHGDYIISSISDLPEFANRWQKEGKLQLIEKSGESDWIIFRVQQEL